MRTALNTLEKHPVRDFLLRWKDKHVSEAELAVLEFGRIFTPINRPKGFRLRKAKQCFANAGDYATRDDPKLGNYVEGFTASKSQTPFHHAWLTLDGETAIDVTLPDASDYTYFGIEFPTVLLRHWITQRGYWGL